MYVLHRFHVFNISWVDWPVDAVCSNSYTIQRSTIRRDAMISLTAQPSSLTDVNTIISAQPQLVPCMPAQVCEGEMWDACYAKTFHVFDFQTECPCAVYIATATNEKPWVRSSGCIFSSGY